MNWLDAPIIIFLGITAFIGSRMGLTKTFLPLAVVVLAIFLAGHFYLSASNYSGSWMSSQSQSQIVAFILIFVLVIVAAIVLFLVGRKLSNLLSKSKVELSRTVIPIAGIVVGIALAGLFYEPVAKWLSHWLTSRSQTAVIAFAIIFILATAVTTKALLSLAALIDKRPYKSFTDKLNGLGGTILGLAIGGLISGALLTLIAKLYYTSVEGTMRGSGLASFLLNNFPFVLRILPKEFDIVRHFFS
jgi:membrane protein required for colicin V production